MTSKLQRNVAPLVACLGLALVPVVSHADDGGGDYDFPASNVVNEPSQSSDGMSCADATRAAWFSRQVEISDGDVSPAIATPPECARTQLAQATTDEDEK